MIANYNPDKDHKIWIVRTIGNNTTAAWLDWNEEWDDEWSTKTFDDFLNIELPANDPMINFRPFNRHRSLDWLQYVSNRERYKLKTGNYNQWKRRHMMWGGC